MQRTKVVAEWGRVATSETIAKKGFSGAHHGSPYNFVHDSLPQHFDMSAKPSYFVLLVHFDQGRGMVGPWACIWGTETSSRRFGWGVLGPVPLRFKFCPRIPMHSPTCKKKVLPHYTMIVYPLTPMLPTGWAALEDTRDEAVRQTPRSSIQRYSWVGNKVLSGLLLVPAQGRIADWLIFRRGV